MEKKAITVVSFNSEALKREAAAQGKQLANCCMQGAKEAASNVAYSGVRLLFDYLIDWVNAKLSA